ncbi:MAG: hypothetical protein IT555_05990 [Acetobacteraceae bacterium]|nr:hypothetical protein [Acetobacteraceae bacterium]
MLPERVQWARTGLWDRLERAAAAIPGAEALKSELRINLPGGRVFQAGGMDNPESWRGGYADEVIEDEADDVTAGGLDMVVEPMLADYLGTRLYVGTPKGNGRLQSRYDEAGHTPGQSRYLLRWQDTGALSAEAIERLRTRLSAEEFAQEMECSFSAPNAGSYYAALLDKAEAENRITRVPHEPRLPVETWWDLGMDDSTAIWFVQRLPGSGEVRVIDYAEASGESLGFYATLLVGKGYSYSAHRLPHDVRVREMGTGKSRMEMLQSLGVAPIRPGRALPVADGINAAKALLPRCWFDAERTAKGRKHLRQYRREWNEEREVWGAKPVHDGASHAADAFREGAVNGAEPRDPMAPPPRSQADGDYDPHAF